MTGKLYIVATPIGNLKDITLRALEVLKEADIIACEDTRRTKKLTVSYGIDTSLTSYNQHNKIVKTKYLIDLIKQGKSAALVSDAGTPCISDPGYFIVNSAKQQQINIEIIPGPCAFTAALSISGFPSSEVFFEGFLPVKSAKRKKVLSKIASYKATSVFYVSPHNIEKVLNEIHCIFQERKIMIAREMTKKFQEIIHVSASELPFVFKNKKPKGEFTLLIAPEGF